MNTEPGPAESIAPPSDSIASPSGTNGFRMVFFGPNGLRAGWRLAMYLALVFAFQFLIIQRGLRLIPGFAEVAKQAQSGGVLTPRFSIIFESAAVLMVFLAAGIMSRIEKRPFGAYGLPLQGAFGRLFWQGALWGLGLETLEMLAMFALGGYSFGSLALAGATLVKYALLWAIGFVVVGIFEEFFFRGYAQYTLGSGIGFWPAAFLLSAAFGAVHLSNPGEGWVGALAVFSFGMLGCLMLRRTGNLWFMVGFHAASDYAETFIYSTPDSGLLAEGHLLNPSFHGPRWLTGGTIGPEGSALAFVVLGIGFIALNFAYPAKKDAEQSR
jgi:uncharacterized protein